MANPEHICILEQGVQAWNAWRESHPDVMPDLTRASLAQEILDGYNFSGCDMRYANLAASCLDGTNLKHADMRYVALVKACLDSASLEGADLRHAILNSAKINQDELAKARTK